MEDSLQFDYVFKFIMVGDASVGKSTLLAMFVNGVFRSESNPTMGVEFATKKVRAAGKVVKIQIWDTAGQQSFRTITRAYYKNAIGIILVYDLTNPKSQDNIQSWLDQIHDNSNEQAEIIIVANKVDLVQNAVTESPHSKYMFIETSAKTGQNINKLFTLLAEKIMKKLQDGRIDPNMNYGIKKGGLTRSLKSKEEAPFDQNQKRGKCC